MLTCLSIGPCAFFPSFYLVRFMIFACTHLHTNKETSKQANKQTNIHILHDSKDRRYSWNYRRARLLFETAWNLPPADGKIEAIAFWDAQARNIFYLNANWKNSTKPTLFSWVLVKTRDNFCGKWTKIVHSCTKNDEKHALSTFLQPLTKFLSTHENYLSPSVHRGALQANSVQYFPV